MFSLTRSLPARALIALAAGSLLVLGAGVAPAAAADDNTISGTVMAGGSPVAGAFVAFWDNDTSLSLPSTSSDPSGYFEIQNVPDGTYAGSANPGDPNGDYTWADVAPFTVGPSNSHQVLTIDLPLWPTGTSSVSGVVTDSVTGDPILDAHISFSGNGSAKNLEVDASSVDGSYAIANLPAGAFRLGVSAPGYVYRSIQFALDSDDAQTVNVELVEANSAIQGKMSFEGTGVGGLWVSIKSGDDTTISGDETDGNGDYGFSDLGAGEYTITVGGAGTPYQKQEKAVTAIANTPVTVDFDLTLRTIGTISGTIYDENGIPLEGICVGLMVSPTEWAEAYFGGMGIGTAADGVYEFEEVDAGTYRIVFSDECSTTRLHAEYALSYFGGTNGAASFAEGTPVVSNGDSVTDRDIQMVRGGTISGTVSLQTSTGVKDLPLSRGMDATIYQNVAGTWAPVPDMSSFVGGPGWGDYQVYGLYPGDYRVCFDDSQITGPRAFAFECWQDAATVEAATSVTVTGGSLAENIDAAIGIPRPGFDPVAVATVDLDPGTEGDITSLGETSPGETLEVDLSEDLAGEWVSIWGHSTPTLMGDWVQVSMEGTVTVPVPDSLPTGNHTLVAQDADGSVIGWSDLHVVESGDSVTRIAGDDRYETAAKIAREWDSASLVYIANGLGFPDALSAGPVAAHLDAPLLLTGPGVLSAAAKVELLRLAPSEIVIVGGTGVVSAAVEAELNALAFDPDVRRIGGVDRYATSRLLVADAFGAGTVATAYLANGANFPDALTASPAAAHFGGPVVLIPGSLSAVDATTLDLLDDLGVDTVKVAGGTGSITAAIVTQLNTKYGASNVTRNGGVDRYATAVEINADEFTSNTTVYLATGTGFADALAGAALAGSQGAPLFVSQPTCIPQAVMDAINDLGATKLVLLGGTGVLSAAVENLVLCG